MGNVSSALLSSVIGLVGVVVGLVVSKGYDYYIRRQDMQPPTVGTGIPATNEVLVNNATSGYRSEILMVTDNLPQQWNPTEGPATQTWRAMITAIANCGMRIEGRTYPHNSSISVEGEPMILIDATRFWHGAVAGGAVRSFTVGNVTGFEDHRGQRVSYDYGKTPRTLNWSRDIKWGKTPVDFSMISDSCRLYRRTTQVLLGRVARTEIHEVAPQDPDDLLINDQMFNVSRARGYDVHLQKILYTLQTWISQGVDLRDDQARFTLRDTNYLVTGPRAHHQLLKNGARDICTSVIVGYSADARNTTDSTHVFESIRSAIDDFDKYHLFTGSEHFPQILIRCRADPNLQTLYNAVVDSLAALYVIWHWILPSDQVMDSRGRMLWCE